MSKTPKTEQSQITPKDSKDPKEPSAAGTWIVDFTRVIDKATKADANKKRR